MILYFCKGLAHMGETSGAGRPVENVVTELPDAAVVGDGDRAGTLPDPEIVSSEDLYHSIRRMRAMAAGLGVRGARTGDGLYDNWAHQALIAAGLMRQLLRERGSQYAALLDEEEATEPHREGVRQLRLH
jgi:hypothetical protein